MNRQSTKFQDMGLEDETLRSEGTQQITGEGLRSSTSSTVNNDAHFSDGIYTEFSITMLNSLRLNCNESASSVA